MKITAQEEYGLRILLRIARASNSDGLTIPEISEAEGLSTHNVAKLCRILRLAGFIRSSRGKTGGYMLKRSPEEIRLDEVLEVLGGRLFSDNFCKNHAGTKRFCSNSKECSVRYLWQIIQNSVDNVLKHITLHDRLVFKHSLTDKQIPKNTAPEKVTWMS